MIDIDDKSSPPTFHDVLLAQERISPYLRPTPVFQSPMMDEAFGFEAFVKCENLQPTGAFKVRGGVNLFSVLPAKYSERGIITASSGNHGQSMSYGGYIFDVSVTVHVPAGTEPLKVRAMETMGAEVICEGRDFDEARKMAEHKAEKEGRYYVHTANEPYLLAGVGTAVLELLESVPQLETLIIPIGCGSIACGGGMVAKTINPGIELIGVQAVGADAVYRSWQSNELQEIPEVTTFAEGIAARRAFELPLRMLSDLLDDFVLVSDKQMRDGMRFLMDMGHLVAEGAGAASTAAALQMSERLAGRKVGIMLSGGNINTDRLTEILST